MGLTALLLAVCLAGLLPVKARASYDPEQREKVRVGFFAMDGYHMMDKNGNLSGYGYEFFQLVSRYQDWTLNMWATTRAGAKCSRCWKTAKLTC